MELKILLPYKVFAEIKNVDNIVAETSEGSVGFLPQRLDCVAVLVAGVVSYKTDKINYLAVDEGLLVKTGSQVFISVKNAIGGVDLGKLADTVKDEFIKNDNYEEQVKHMVLKLENGFLSKLKKYQEL
ncbi:MAG: F0F1 ATP synthase subunit epsilon [Pelobium sp.]